MKQRAQSIYMRQLNYVGYYGQTSLIEPRWVDRTETQWASPDVSFRCSI